MLEELQIPAEYVEQLCEPELLIMADCQYGTGNVTRFEAKQVAVIDHHQPDPRGMNTNGGNEDLTDIRSRI